MGTHLEYISDQKFNGSFKNMLRDFYSYGFKSQSEYVASYKTFNDDRARLVDFLRNRDYMRWEAEGEKKGKTNEYRNVTFITCDSQSMSINPFQFVYRFCGTNRPNYLYSFFHIIAALDDNIRPADGTYLSRLEASNELHLMRINIIEESLLDLNVDSELIDKLENCFVCRDISTLEKYLSTTEILGVLDKIRYRKVKSSEIARYFLGTTPEMIAEAKVNALNLKVTQKSVLIDNIQNSELFYRYAVKFGLEKEQIFSILDSVPTGIIGVINSMNFEKEVRKRLVEKSGKTESLISEAKELLLPEDIIKRLEKASLDRKERRKTQDTINQNINNRLQRLNNIGIVRCEQKKGDLVFTQDQMERVLVALPKQIREMLESKDMEKDYESFKRKLSVPNRGDQYWYLSGLTLKKIIDAGKKINDEFLHHFEYAIDYYSKVFSFGEIGMFLQDRLRDNYESYIRIEHEYYMHSLNDFNAIDLYAAIENNIWCLIVCERDQKKTKLLCYPIELRISSTNGREYLIYYEPLKKSCLALRLEFIESIVYYSDDEIRKKLAEYIGNDVDIDQMLDENINRSRLLMEYTWGVSTEAGGLINLTKIDEYLKEINLRIEYNSETDYYILNRIYRESRIGTISVNNVEGYIEFSVVVCDINEMIPFIRSFYSRIISCTGYDSDGFSIEFDIDCIKKQVKRTEPLDKNDNWNSDNSFIAKLGDGQKAYEHDKLFNEVFSVFYHMFGSVFEKIISGKGVYSYKDIICICENSVNEFKEKCGTDMIWKAFDNGKVFWDLLLDGGFLIEEIVDGEYMYRSKYKTVSNVDMYKDIIPLSQIEIRWLRTIIDDEKMHYFLSNKEIMVVKAVLTATSIGIKPFSMQFINYFDRYKFSQKKEWKEGEVLLPILNAIRDCHIINIRYISNKKNTIMGQYKPIVVEFSKRDNCFKGYFMSTRKKEGMKVYNLSQFLSVEDTGERFDRSEVNECFNTYRAEQIDTVEIKFEDCMGIADRVLTELSPWKKVCCYDNKDRIYKLTVYYPKSDATDMAVRLLRFGSSIRFDDSNSRVARIIQKKLDDQLKLLNNQKSKSKRNYKSEGVDR